MEVFLFIMKKLAAFILFIIILSYTFEGYAFDNNVIKREKALSIIDEKLNILKNFDDYNAQYREFTNGGSIWLFNFSSIKGEFKSANVFLNSKTGDIIKYELFKDTDGTKDVGKQKAFLAAEEFLRKVSPKNLSHYIKDEKIYNEETTSTYNFKWSRFENGVEVLYDSIDIAVDKSTGEVVYYSYKWTEGDLPELINNMDKNEALKLFRYFKSPKLVYALLCDNKKEHKLISKI